MKPEYRKSDIISEKTPEGIVRAYLTKWGTVDSYNSTFLRGSFQKTFSERKIRLIWNHDALAGKVVDAAEDDYGPLVTCKFNTDTEAGRTAFAHVQHGDVDCFSFGFWCIADGIQNGVREIREVEVIECGPVIFPANSNAVITQIRGVQMEQELKVLEDRLKREFEVFKDLNDTAIAEAEKRGGEATAETRKIADDCNAALTEIRQAITDLQKRADRPNMPTLKSEPSLETRAFEKFVRYGAEDMEPAERRALGTTLDTDGGFLVPPEYENGIIMKAYNSEAIRPFAAPRRTGRDVYICGSLSKPSVAWGRQNVAVTAQDLKTGGERIEVFALKALALISNDTLDDTEADLAAELTAAFGLALAEAEDNAFAVGAGHEGPKGIVETRTKTVFALSGVAAALSDANNNGLDALISCYYKLKSQYRKNGVWLMNSKTEAEVRKLKDGDKQYLWQPSVQAGAPPNILGRPIANPEGMADIAAGAFPIVFGDVAVGYRIVDRQGLVMRRLTERYAEYDQTGFIIKKRVGAQVILDEAFACVKIAAS